jgi:hypothetical protein
MNLRGCFLCNTNVPQAPSIFPIVFAAAVGRAIRVLALWRLERGERLGNLDQLFGSTSVFQTVMTQINLRAYGWLGFALAALWILSPFGGQASLRIVESGNSRNTSLINLEYLSMLYQPGDPFTTSAVMADSEYSQSQTNAFFTSALIGSQEVKFSTYDTWGNVKIPMLESINSSRFPSDRDGWTSLGRLTSQDLECSSLIGIPIAGLPASGASAKFSIETSYWFVGCPVLQAGRQNFELAKQPLNGPAGFHLTSNVTLRTLTNGQLDPFSRPRRMNYFGTWIDRARVRHYDYAECDITTSFVEVEVQCLRFSCTALRMRPSRAPVAPTFAASDAYFPPTTSLYDVPFQFPANWTSLDGLGAIPTASDDVFGNFSQSFTKLSANFDGLNATATPTEYYFLDQIRPYNFNASNMTSLNALSPDLFGIRLAQLLNTFWLAAIGNEVISLGRAADFLQLLQNPQSNLRDILRTTATTAETDVFLCNRRWLAVLLIATSFVFFAGIVGIVLACISHAPVLAMNASTLLRETIPANIPLGGMALDDDERGRLLRDVKIRLGDMASWEDVGRLGVGGLCGNGMDPRSLDRERYFW